MRAVLHRVSTVPWHPAAFAAGWVLSAWVAASPSPYAALRALGVALAAAGMLTVIGRAALQTWQRGALFATLLILGLTQGRDASIVVGNIAGALPQWQTAVLAGSLIVIVGAVAYLVRGEWRRPNLSGRVGRYLNLVSAVLCALALAGGIPRGSYDARDLQQGAGLSSVARASAPRTGPNIYVILLDGYPRADTLRETYGFDNSDFLEALRTRGFWVDPASHSNYVMTELSLISFFNMAQLQDLPELGDVLDGTIPPQPTARHVLNENRVFADLRARGYDIVSYAIPYEGPALRQADVVIDLGGVNEFERGLISSSFLLDLTDLVNRNAIADDMRAQIIRALEAIPVVAADQELGPHMVFAHVLAPHGPFLFDAAGNPITSGLPHRHQDWVTPTDLSEAEFGALMTGQIQYVNRAVLDAIDGVLAASVEPPIVIVMSDHGVRARPMNLASLTTAQLRDAFGSLFAAYTPGQPGLYAPGTTPSQVMANLLNAYFDAGLPVATSDAFISTGSDPYNLIPTPVP